MKTLTKALFTLGAAAVAGVAAYEVVKKESKKFYQSYYQGGSEPLDTTSWLAYQPKVTHTLKNRSGLLLTGYHVPKVDSNFTMVIIHGYRSQALNMNRYAEVFYKELNCDLFLPDLRGHGKSEGDYVGWGWEDKEDIKEWMHYLAKQFPARKFVLFGESMGGATVNYLSCEDMPNVKVLVEDCGFSDLYEEFNHQSKKIVHLPFAPFYKSFNKEVEENHHYDIKDANCINCVKYAKYPMMFVHGLSDEVVPCQMAYDLYNACPTDKQLFVVKGANHTECIKLNPEGYLASLKEFLNEHL